MATMLIDRDFDNPLVNQSGQKTKSYGSSESSSKEWLVKPTSMLVTKRWWQMFMWMTFSDGQHCHRDISFRWTSSRWKAKNDHLRNRLSNLQSFTTERLFLIHQFQTATSRKFLSFTTYTLEMSQINGEPKFIIKYVSHRYESSFHKFEKNESTSNGNNEQKSKRYFFHLSGLNGRASQSEQLWFLVIPASRITRFMIRQSLKPASIQPMFLEAQEFVLIFHAYDFRAISTQAKSNLLVNKNKLKQMILE